MLTPSPAEFVRLAAGGETVPVARTFVFDADTAVTAYAKLFTPPFGFLLESVEGGEKWARYTFLGTGPREAWRLKDGRVDVWSPDRGWEEQATIREPLADLARRLRSRRVARVDGLPRFVGGAVGYLGYDVVRHIERLPPPPADDRGLPDALLVYTDTLLAIDNLFGRAHAITLVDTLGLDDAALDAHYGQAVARVDALVHGLATTPPPAPLHAAGATASAVPPGATGAHADAHGAPPPAPAVRATSNMTRAAYEAGVERIRAYIRAGDAFQVVLSQRLEAPLPTRPFDVYRALRSLNPSPYLFYLELDGLHLIGSSPEALVRLEAGTVTVRPIAGTRPRGGDDATDRARGEELLADPKERAEHLMLVDLGRNDVGRVARFGSVHVPQFMSIERYSHVLHLVSQVEGQLDDGLDAVDVFRACFPAGTVSGAPKVRAMEIIDELEPTRRGPYAGAVGYFAWGGDAMDTAIAIRTIVARNGVAWVQAGAGVVADSVPQREFEETLAKAAALLRVLGV